MSQVTVTNTIIQTTVNPKMRGRVISLYAMAFFGMQPLGGLLIGSISRWIGTTDTLMGQGIIALVLAALHGRHLHKEKLKHQQDMILKEEHHFQAL
jgi:hypothetical protein